MSKWMTLLKEHKNFVQADPGPTKPAELPFVGFVGLHPRRDGEIDLPTAAASQHDAHVSDWTDWHERAASMLHGVAHRTLRLRPGPAISSDHGKDRTMTVKRRIDKLECRVSERSYRDEQYALWAMRLNRARARKGLLPLDENTTKAAPNRTARLNAADFLRQARLRAKG